MANTLKFKRGLLAGIPTAALGEPLFTTDTFDLYIGNGTGNTRFQKYIASGTTSQLLRGDGSLLTMPIVLTSPANGEVLKYNGTTWVNSSDAGITGSGVAGQVAYFTGATTQGGSNNLFWDATNNRLGIGTNAPAYLLDILTNQNAGTIASLSNSTSGTGAFTGFRIGSSANVWLYNFSTAYTTSGRFVAGTFLIDAATSNGININNTNAAPIAFGISNTEGMRLDASRNLLIGNITGTARLDVQTTAQLIANLASSNVSGGYITLGRTGAASIIGAYSSASGGGALINADALFFRNTTGVAFSGSGANPKLWLTTTDNLVLNSTTDNGLRFQVTGDGSFSGYVNAASFRPTGSTVPTNGLYLPTTNTMGWATNSTERMRLDASGNLGLGVTPSAWNTLIPLQIARGSFTANNSELDINHNAFYDGAWKYIANGFATNHYTTSGTYVWRTAASGTAGAAITFTQAMTLDASGNLGLGVTPSFKLDVVSSSGYNSIVGRGASGSYFETYTIGGTRHSSFGSESNGDVYLGARANNPMLFLTNNTVQMRLFANGNLGVGVSSDAGFRLDINGTMRVSGASTFNANMGLTLNQNAATTLTITNTTSGTASSVYTRYISNTTSGEFQVGKISTLTTPYKTTAANDSFLYNSSVAGNICILNDFASGNINLTAGGSSTAHFTIASTGAATFSSSVTAGGNLIVDTDTLFVDSSTNRVGIGTVSATGKLHVNGSLGSFRVLDSGAEVYFSRDNNNDIYANGGSSAAISIGAQSHVRFLTGTTLTERARFDTTGNFSVDSGVLYVDAVNNRVGINDINPDYTLDVNGSLNSIQARFGNVAGRGLTIGTSAISGTNDAGVVFNAPTATDGTLVFQTSSTDRMTLNSSGLNVATAIAIGTTPDTNLPFKILKNINSTVGIRFENTSTGASAYSAVQFGTDVSGGTAFTNMVYGSSGITESGVYKPNGTALINTGSGGLNFLAVSQPIRFFTSTGNGTLRAAITNDGDYTHYNGTNPSASTTDAFRMYSADITAGNAAPHFRTENGGIIKLYQQTTAVTSATYIGGAGTTVTDLDTFDGYTIPQIVKALRNAGLLA